MNNLIKLAAIIMAVISLSIISCDSETGNSSPSPNKDKDKDNPLISQPDTKEMEIRINICDLSTDKIKAVEFKWGYGIYQSSVATPFTKSVLLGEKDVSSWNMTSPTSGEITFKTYLFDEELFFDVRLLSRANVCIGNLAQIWQRSTALIDSIIDVTCDGVYGEQTINYHSR